MAQPNPNIPSNMQALTQAPAKGAIGQADRPQSVATMNLPLQPVRGMTGPERAAVLLLALGEEHGIENLVPARR